jgi:putative aminopeptidase FrvX
VLLSTAKEPPPLAGEIGRAAAAAGLPLQSGAGTESPLLAAFADEGADAVVLAIPVMFLNTPSEIVDLKDVAALGSILAALFETGGAK